MAGVDAGVLVTCSGCGTTVMQKAMVPVILAPAEAEATAAGETAPLTAGANDETGTAGEAANGQTAPAETLAANGETGPPANEKAPSDTLDTAAMSYLCLPCARLRISIPAG